MFLNNQISATKINRGRTESEPGLIANFGAVPMFASPFRLAAGWQGATSTAPTRLHERRSGRSAETA